MCELERRLRRDFARKSCATRLRPKNARHQPESSSLRRAGFMRRLSRAKLPEREKGKDRDITRHYSDFDPGARHRNVPIG